MSEASEVYPDFPDDDPAGEPVAADDEGVADVVTEPAESGTVRTGDPRVDAVLDSLSTLDGLPVGEHAAVFERAHEGLRAALEPERESSRESA